MTAVVIVGSQWGDEGKGKITDFVSQQADVISRYQGGDNAGHTITFNGEKYQLQLLPSGIFESDKQCLIGNGVVLNPKTLLAEIDYLHERGISTDNLRISDRAHVIFPYHILQDQLEEASKKGSKIGTTNKGIGPAYMDKASRIGIRVADLLEPETFKTLLARNVIAKNELLAKLYGAEPIAFEPLLKAYQGYAERLAKYVTDTSKVLDDALSNGQRLLFEGAQGVMLDIDHGTYPYVTSSNPVAGGVTIGGGIGPTRISAVIGAAKAYTSRVGDGPFPTELHDEKGDHIREVGHEYGTVTKRPRRIGWLDTVVLRHAKRVSGLNYLALNCLDVLTGLPELKICTAYELDGETIDRYPAGREALLRCKPVYETLPGWTEDITNCKTVDDLPKNARQYVERVMSLTGLPLATLSVGPDRKQTMVLKDVWQADMKVEEMA
ncbi:MULTISPECIES: adenylosuccinate synthase [Furfurilactobacillus]|uniref:Adenylosuccinate synthetase n=1 Tax=Furfurilactobacillus rossiae TaxID=231049 RepID=A0A7C9N8M2_9LACO|nr:adenylosuccinate synthase [Furfurilactobacillus milii]MYV05966.1 adenylosuccinate synthase [Furfurilactobacillus milii]